MEIETWQVFVWLVVVLVFYWVSVTFLNVTPSIEGFVVLLVFGSLGALIGRYLNERFANGE